MLSPDASGRGALYALASQGDRLVAAGIRVQIYMRSQDGIWSARPIESSPEGLPTPDFGAANDISGTVYIVGSPRPAAKDGSASDYDVTADPNYSDDIGVEDLMSLFERHASSSSEASPVGCLAVFDGTRAELVTLPPMGLRDVCQGEKDNVYLVGASVVILKGHADRGFEPISFKGDDAALHSATWFQNRLIVASDYALYAFDGHLLSRMRPLIDPSVNRGVPTPLKVQAIDGVLWYFDYNHGVSRFDGATWDNISMPPELLERDFKKLRTVR